MTSGPSEAMPRLRPLDFEVQKSSLSRMPGLVMFGCVRTLKYLEIICSRRDWELDGFPKGDDMFVDFDLAMDVVNNYMGPNVRVYATNEYMHSGIREDGKRIIDKMIAMLDDSDPLR